MDHEHTHHGDMGHGGMDHGGMDMGSDQCSMNMLFTWSTKNLCIVFPQWRVSGPFSLVFSLVGVVLLTAGYELVRDWSRQYEAYEASIRQTEGNNPARRLSNGQEQKIKTVKAGLYALQVFYSFFVMLLFMTYNGWIMLAVAAGAFVGYMAFGSTMPATKSVACH